MSIADKTAERLQSKVVTAEKLDEIMLDMVKLAAKHGLFAVTNTVNTVKTGEVSVYTYIVGVMVTKEEPAK